MSNVRRLVDRQTARIEAGQWLARIDRGLNESERLELQNWMRDPRCAEALESLAKAWDSLDMVEELAELFPLNRFDDRHRYAARWAIAGALLATVASVALLLHTRPWRSATSASSPVAALSTTGVPAFNQDFTTDIGDQRVVELPDHSRIHLNTRTQIQVRYSAAQRLIIMSGGEAMFAVAKEPGRVFTVRVGGVDFNAIGTAFNIRADVPGQVKLTVTEGRVSVHSLDGAGSASTQVADVLIEANRSVTLSGGGKTIASLSAGDMATATAWQHGVVTFEKVPLGHVVTELSRYSRTPFVVADRDLAGVAVTGYFNVEDIDSLVTALEQNVGVQVVKSNDQFILIRSQNETHSP